MTVWFVFACRVSRAPYSADAKNFPGEPLIELWQSYSGNCRHMACNSFRARNKLISKIFFMILCLKDFSLTVEQPILKSLLAGRCLLAGYYELVGDWTFLATAVAWFTSLSSLSSRDSGLESSVIENQLNQLWCIRVHSKATPATSHKYFKVLSRALEHTNT